MAINDKETLKYFGLPEETDDAGFKKHIEETFIRRDAVPKDEKLAGVVTGKAMGIERKEVRSQFQQMGIDIEPKEIEKLYPHEIVKIGLEKLGENFEASKKELQGQIGKSQEDAVKEWKEKAEKAENKATDFKQKFSDLGKEFETYKTTEKEREKKKEIEGIFEKAFNAVPKRNQIPELELTGFRAHLEKNFKIDLETDGTPFITDLKGERLKDPNKAGETFTVEAAFKHIANEKNISPKNDIQTKRVFNPENYNGNNGNGQHQQQTGQPARKISHKIK